MDSVSRLQLAARGTYYVGWIPLVCGGLVQLSVARGMFLAMSLKRSGTCSRSA